MPTRSPTETETDMPTDDDRSAPAADAGHREVYGNGAAALRALRKLEPRDPGERVIVEAVQAISRRVEGVDRHVNDGFLALREHVDGIVEELRAGIANLAASQGGLAASSDVRELLGLVRELDAHVRGARGDRPSEPATPSAKQRVSRVTAPQEEDEDDVAGTGDDP
jgi:hypothetical protein